MALANKVGHFHCSNFRQHENSPPHSHRDSPELIPEVACIHQAIVGSKRAGSLSQPDVGRLRNLNDICRTSNP